MVHWIFTDLVVAFILLFASFIAHEAGHILAAKKFGYQTKTRFKGLNFEVVYWPNVTVSDEIKVLERGIFFGFAVSLLSVLLCVYWSPMVLIAYFFGCKYDFKRLKFLYKNRNI